MLDDTVPNTDPEPIVQIQETPQEPPPPAGDSEKSEKYLNQLTSLINQDKLAVFHTDLNQFDVASIEDHYRMDLGEYEVEINHSKQPDTGQDFYIMLFNNIKKIEGDGENCVNKVILAYTHLSQSQFEDFKEAADASLNRKKAREDAKRFTDAMNPIDNLLENLSSSQAPIEEDNEPEELSDTNDENEDQGESPDDSSDNSPKASDFLSQPPTSF
jgi:hypothetical protein